MQIARLRELAAYPEISEAARKRVEERIAEGLTDEEAYRLIRALGGRIAAAREGRAA